MSNDTEQVKYPDIEVELVGGDGNAFAIIGAVTKALKRAKVDRAEIDAFTQACFQAESYDALLQLVMQTVVVS